MKTTDLMIGDWMLMRGTPVQVRAIGVDTIRFSNMLITEPLENIEPIPLTPEILEKNGWELTKTASSKHYWHDDVPFHIPIEPYHHWRGDEDRIFADDFFDSVFIRLGYVHELQHALKLCGIDKEIVL